MNPAFPFTIIVNNYNYARFLPRAIESALAQTYPWTEVIVVDDGSTDDSRAVIRSYGDRVVPVFKENAGQASALNSGFARCGGRAVIFLDADDTLHPDIVERVVACFQADPSVVRVQYRLAVIDAAGTPTGMLKPPLTGWMPSGDLRREVLLYADDIPWLPTSGNAFSADMLRRIFPIPEDAYRICADFYLSNLSPLFGRVISLAETGGYYRVHGSNHHAKAQLDLQQTRQIIVRTRQTHGHIRDHAQRLGLTDTLGEGVAALSTTFVANRLVSLRLDHAQHPIAGDNRFALARRGVRAAWRRPDLPLLARVMYMAWFLLAAVAPQRAVPSLADQFFFPESRNRWLDRLLARLRRIRPMH